MRKKLLLLMLALAWLPSHGQTAVVLGDEINASRSGTLQDIVAHDQTGFYALRSESRRAVMLEHYDYDLKLIKKAELNLGKRSDEREYEFILPMSGQLYLFTSINESKPRKNVLFAQRINLQTLQPEENLRRVAEIDYSKKRNDGSYGYRMSPDSTNLLIHYNLPYDKGEPEAFGFSVMDKNMAVSWHKDVRLPYNDELFKAEKFNIDNKGNVYLLGIVYRGKAKEKHKGLPNYDYRLFSYAAQGTAVKEYQISLKKNFITDMQIAVKEDGEVVGSGYYSEEGTTSIKGTFFVTLDAGSRAVRSEHTQAFSKEFLAGFMSERKAEKGKELYEYDLDHLQLRSDGGAVLVAEQYYIRVVYNNHMSGGMMMSSSPTFYYFYNDIIVTSINPDGSIAWSKKIPKRQVTKNDGGFFSSYSFAESKDKMYFIFNDHTKNLDNPDLAKPANYNGKTRESAVVLVSIDRQGNVQKQALLNTRDAEVTIRPKVCEQVSGKEVVLFGERKSDHKFAKLTLR